MASRALDPSTVGVRGRVRLVSAKKQRCVSVNLTDMSCTRAALPDLGEQAPKYAHSLVDYFFNCLSGIDAWASPVPALC